MPNDAPRSCDTLIRHGSVIDGTGEARFAADVAIAGDRIVAVGDLSRTTAALEVDATDRIVAPGFIDVHTHDDRALLSTPAMTAKVSQGVTTVVAGNCGISLSPLRLDRRPPPPLDLLGTEEWYSFPAFADYRAALERTPPAVNAALLIGHSTLRVGTMSDIDRPASDREIARMREKLREGLAHGAVGFSTGLFYATNAAATTDEVVAVAEELSAFAGLYVTHMRDEQDRVAESLEETFEIGRRAGVPVVVSHHKVAGRRNFGRSIETLALIDQARRRQRVGLDVYPYDAGSTVLLPHLIERGEKTLITWSEAHPELAGRYLDDIAAEWGCAELAAAERLQPAGAIYFMMDEADVRRILAYPHTMIGSDGLPHDKHPHPRLWGTFPRILGHYARDQKLFGLEEAVHRMTGLSAAQFGLESRGVIRAGAHADITIFDAATVIDRSTFENPTLPAAGIDVVIVNGEPVWRDGRESGARPGRVLERQATNRA